ncbi:MAG: DNA polymerase IV [bacterium]|nr:DNA polymerase IV [bacterium]
MQERTILHMDMDAFFASVEQQSRPHLRGKPVAVVGSGQRTVVTTASYEARAAGVRTGMNLFQARRACPQLLVVVGNNRKYMDTSSRIVRILYDFTPQVEVFSIDEAFLDVSGSRRLFGSAETIARRIKKAVLAETGLTCSVGVAPNRLLSKLAAGMEKPDGLVVVEADHVDDLLERLPVEKLCGIGKKMTAGLASLGISTCGELGRFSVETLRQRFGVFGETLGAMGRGIDPSSVVTLEEESKPKSLGHQSTLPRDADDPKTLHRVVLNLSEMVGRRARRNGLWGSTVTLTIRYRDFRTVTRRRRVEEGLRHGPEIFRVARDILADTPLEQPVRLVGVTLSGLASNGVQLSLFSSGEKESQVAEAMDRINERYGGRTITWGTLVQQSGSQACLPPFARVISPAWRPKGSRFVNVH